MPSNKGGIYATVKGEPEPDYWGGKMSYGGLGVDGGGFVSDDDQVSIGGSGILDTGLFELRDDFKAEYVRRVVMAQPGRGSLDY